MKVEQLSLQLEALTALKEVKIGQTFLTAGQTLCLRVKPVAWMLNSTLIQDKITQGYVMYADLESGKCSWARGDCNVEVVNATCKWKK